MPPAFKVELLPHDPAWADLAAAEARSLAGALGSLLLAVHHVGSTAIAGIRAKPVVDLLPVVANVNRLYEFRDRFLGLGYEWWGEYGLPGRRYCTKDDPASGRRLFQLHCYEQGSPEVTRHLAFRDFMRAHPEEAAAYERVKVDCQKRNGGSSHAYSDCKGPWIAEAEKRALGWYQGHEGA